MREETDEEISAQNVDNKLWKCLQESSQHCRQMFVDSTVLFVITFL